MKITPALFPKTAQMMALIYCLGLGCSVQKAIQQEGTKPAITADKQSVPKAVQQEGTKPAIAADKQSVPKAIQQEDTKPVVATDKESDKSTEVKPDESQMELVKESQKQSQKEKGPVKIKEPVKQHKKPVPKVDPSKILSHHEVKAIFKGYTFVCSDRNALFGSVPKSNFGRSRCRKNVLNAYFKVSRYTRYRKKDPAGEKKQKSVLINVITPHFQTILDSLTLEDRVLLHWNHTKGDARKYGTDDASLGSIGGFLIQREISLLKCLKTCGKGVVAQKTTFRPFMNKQNIAPVNFQIRWVYLDKDGSMELNRGSEKALTHQTIRKFIKKNKLKNRMKACQKKVSASLGHNSKAYGKLILSVEISKKTPLEIKIKKSRLKSKELMQCAAKVLQSIKPFKHSLSFKAKAIVHVNFIHDKSHRRFY